MDYYYRITGGHMAVAARLDPPAGKHGTMHDLLSVVGSPRRSVHVA